MIKLEKKQRKEMKAEVDNMDTIIIKSVENVRFIAGDESKADYTGNVWVEGFNNPYPVYIVIRELNGKTERDIKKELATKVTNNLLRVAFKTYREDGKGIKEVTYLDICNMLGVVGNIREENILDEVHYNVGSKTLVTNRNFLGLSKVVGIK
jgi:hypothetical protein